MKQIQLTQGKIALVSDDKFLWLNQWRWFAKKRRGGFEAGRTCYCWLNGKRHYIPMHRQITSCPKGKIVDHHNHNATDNQDDNLRVATYAQNNFNSRKYKNNTTGYKGVHRAKSGDRWEARIRHNGKLKHLGTFSTPRMAAKVYDKKAKELFREFALTNF